MDIVKSAVCIFGFLLCHPEAEGGNVDFADRTFVSVWNAPSAICESKFGVQLDLSYFDIVANHNDTFAGDEIVIFYGSRLGLLPSIDAHGKFIHGGLPQLANITAHLAKVTSDVEHYMRNVGFNGLAVIDWESWRPIFRRDHYNTEMRRYIQASEDLVRKHHPDWSKGKIEDEARKEFENGARIFIQSTLDTCRKLRPGGYWGLYLFPECYNRGHGERHCSNTTEELNDRLSWMFKASTALYPSIYLKESGTSVDKYDHVYGELKEALRVKKAYGGKKLAIAPYSKIRYKDTKHFYNQADLNNTILQAAEAGLDAIVLWGSSSSYRSARQCEETRDYLDSTLGPFIRNVTIAARNCSDELCNSHGRCFKTDWSYKSDTPDTLFFEPASNGLFKSLVKMLLDTISGAIREIGRSIRATDVAEPGHTGGLYQRFSGFSCSCFEGWTGEYCQRRSF
ncbi:hyaluronidase-1-like [Mercenaria mercenaria]|uniref:hyaluronidase-1-like n=1 Tax=Mercenaria mercenaria TaxID=6596 RepID=UPI00234EA084|nr:hyaluronidase-1-like [Mercenaria mercenaria]